MSGKIKVDEVSVGKVVVVVVGLAGEQAGHGFTHWLHMAAWLGRRAKAGLGWDAPRWLNDDDDDPPNTCTHTQPHPLRMALLAALAREQ